MKKYLTLATAVASTVAISTAASAALSGFEVGVGISHINFGGTTKQTDTTPAKADIKKTAVAGDFGVGYGFAFGRWQLTPLAFIQTGGGTAEIFNGDVTIKRKWNWGLALRAGFDVAPRSAVYLKIGAKQGNFTYKNDTAKKKDEKPWGLMGGVGFAFNVSEKVSLDLGYTYVNYGNLKSNRVTGQNYEYKTKMSENDVRLGVSYKF